eukprot:scaffold21156_cov41-Attheya_sp.AAC.3
MARGGGVGVGGIPDAGLGASSWLGWISLLSWLGRVGACWRACFPAFFEPLLIVFAVASPPLSPHRWGRRRCLTGRQQMAAAMNRLRVC